MNSHRKTYQPTILQLIIALLIINPVFSLWGMAPQMPSVKERQEKAAFILNITRFINWGENVLPHDTLVIGILGDNAMATSVEEAIEREKEGHSIRVENFTTVEDVENCHVLFIQETDDSNTQDILNQLKGTHILTIGQSFFFIKMGGMMRLYQAGNKIKLQINLDQINNESFTVNSKLLRIAEVFGTAKN